LKAIAMEYLPVSEYWGNELQGTGIYLRKEFLSKYNCNVLN
jgi:hypothetical protein